MSPNPLPENLERCYWCAGLLLNFLVEAGESGGEYTLIDGHLRRGAEPPPHTHTLEDEELYVLQGRLRYRFGDAQAGFGEGELGPGGFARLPRRLEHHFECLTPEVRLLVRLSPGGLEEAFKRFGVAAKDSPLPPPPGAAPGLEAVARIFAERGVYFRPRAPRTDDPTQNP